MHQTIEFTKINSFNSLTTEVEKTFMDNYSILTYDDESGVWTETFADTYEKAVQIAHKQHKKELSKF
jgi:Zn-dependent metalloprotease